MPSCLARHDAVSVLTYSTLVAETIERVEDALTDPATKSSAAITVCTEREYLPDIAETLGVNDIPSWPADRCVCFSARSF